MLDYPAAEYTNRTKPGLKQSKFLPQLLDNVRKRLWKFQITSKLKFIPIEICQCKKKKIVLNSCKTSCTKKSHLLYFYLPFPLILNVAGRTAYSMWLWRWSDLDLNTNLQFTHYMTLGQWCTFLSFFFFLICKRMFAMDVYCLCCLISVLLSFITGTQFSFENPPTDTQAWCFARVGGTEVILFLSRGARVIQACPGSNGHCCRI